MKRKETNTKSDAEERSRLLQRKPGQRRVKSAHIKPEDRFQQTSLGDDPESLASVLDTPELSHSVNVSHRRNIVDRLQQTYGNARIKGTIQAKLKIGKPDDKYEQEADRVADEVMRMPEIQIRQRLDGEFLEQESNLSQSSDAKADLGRRIASLRGNGRRLSECDKAFFGPRFGHNLSHIRVYIGSEATKLSHELDARAFTIGRDIVFEAGQYMPGTMVGRRLLAHELTHVLQQSPSKQNDVVRRQKRGETKEPKVEESESYPIPYRDPEDAKDERLFMNNPEAINSLEERLRKANIVHYLTFAQSPRNIYSLGFSNLKLINANPLPIPFGIQIGPYTFLAVSHGTGFPPVLCKEKRANSKYGEHFVVRAYEETEFEYEVISHRMDLIKEHLRKIREQ